MYEQQYNMYTDRQVMLERDDNNLTRTWASGDEERLKQLVGDTPDSFGKLYPREGLPKVGRHKVKGLAATCFNVEGGQTYRSTHAASASDVA